MHAFLLKMIDARPANPAQSITSETGGKLQLQCCVPSNQKTDVITVDLVCCGKWVFQGVNDIQVSEMPSSANCSIFLQAATFAAESFQVPSRTIKNSRYAASFENSCFTPLTTVDRTSLLLGVGTYAFLAARSSSVMRCLSSTYSRGTANIPHFYG